jgi:putative hydrolase of the HAD superfamily
MLMHTLFFDLDDTLYPKSTGLWNAIRDRMHTYMAEIVALPPAEIEALRQHYLETYGTTLRGLQIHYAIDTDKYLAYVHDLPLSGFIRPDPGLGKLLATLPQRKFIFTNADIHHARRVLAILQLGDCFEQIIDIRALGFVCKPDTTAYSLALNLAGVTDPGECILFDDAPRNLAPAREQGWYTVLIGDKRADPTAVQSIASLHELPQAMPQLWNHHR